MDNEAEILRGVAMERKREEEEGGGALMASDKVNYFFTSTNSQKITLHNFRTSAHTSSTENTRYDTSIGYETLTT